MLSCQPSAPAPPARLPVCPTRPVAICLLLLPICLPAPPAGDPYKVVEPADAELKMPLRVAGRGVQAGPVRSLSFLRGPASGGGTSARGSGSGAGNGAEDCLLVFGGQGKEEPDMLTLLPLVAQQAGEGGGRQVPWFGNIKGLCQVRGGSGCGREDEDGLVVPPAVPLLEAATWQQFTCMSACCKWQF